jgi:hypothetical protein
MGQVFIVGKGLFVLTRCKEPPSFIRERGEDVSSGRHGIGNGRPRDGIG